VNILFLSELFYPHGGGAELATYLYAKLLSQKGFKVKVVTNRFTKELGASQDRNLIVYRLPLFSGLGSKFSVLLKPEIIYSSFLRKLVKWADVVYVPRLWFSAIPLAKAYKKAVIVHIHDFIPICPLSVLYDFTKNAICQSNASCSASCIYFFEMHRKRGLIKSAASMVANQFFKKFANTIVKYADAIVCVSRAQRDILAKYDPRIAEKLRVIYNPLPNLHSVDVNGHDFGYLGGKSPLKGFTVLQQAIRELESLSIVIHAAGFSRLADEKIEEYKRLGMLVYKRLNYSEQEFFYRKIRGIIFPSIVLEPLPYTTAEALLRARILIASRVGGIPEQVAGCKGVFLFESGNYVELAETLRYVNDLSKEEATDLGFQNREVFTKTHKNEATIRKFTDLITSLI